MNHQQAPDKAEQFRSFMGWLAFACQGLAVSVEVFLHKSRSFGERYIGLQFIAAVVTLFLFPALFPEHDPRPVWWFLMAFLAMCGFARLGVAWRRWRRPGVHVHTFYTGQPRLMRLMGRLNEVTVKRAVEPLLVFIGGALLLPLSEPLGVYLMLAGFGLFASVNLRLGFEQTRVLDMKDAFLDQRSLSERFRDAR